MGTVKDMLEYKLDYAEGMLEVEGIGGGGGGTSNSRPINQSSPLQPSQKQQERTSFTSSPTQFSLSSSEKEKKTQQMLEQSTTDHNKQNSSISRTFRSNDSALRDGDNTPRPVETKKFRAMSVSLNPHDSLSFGNSTSPSHPSVTTAAAAAAAAMSEAYQPSDHVALPKIDSKNSLSSTTSSTSNLAHLAGSNSVRAVDNASPTATGHILNSFSYILLRTFSYSSLVALKFLIKCNYTHCYTHTSRNFNVDTN